jgi:HEAT repeat protein
MEALDAGDVAGLVARLKDPNARSRRIAAYGIGMVAKRTENVAALEEAVEPLTAALTDPDPLVRRGAANGIGIIALKSGDRARFERAVRPLGEVTRDSDTFVAAHAARALERIGTPPARAIAGAHRRRENLPAEAPLVVEEGVVEAPPESE